jgi:hypothetical protein
MKILSGLAFALVPFVVTAQKKVVSIPFEFEKKKSAYEAYFLDNQANSIASIVLKDNVKAEYIQLDKNLAIVSKIDLAIDGTVFKEDITDYRGGTAHGRVFNFVYEEKEKKSVTNFLLESVNFDTKKVTQRSLFEIPKTESVIASFSDNNTFYTITADNKAGELVFYVVNEAGVVQQKHLGFKLPEGKGKITDYFSELQIFKSNEEPDLANATTNAKLFSSPHDITFVVNQWQKPVHVFTVQLPDFSTKERFIDVSSFKKVEKEGLKVNSFKKDNQLFTLILNNSANKSIQVAIHNIGTGELLGKQEITKETDKSLLAQPPMDERRTGKKLNEKELNHIVNVIADLNHGTDAIVVSQNEKGQYIVAIGTHDPIKSSSGSSGGYVGGYQTSTMAVTPGITNHGATYSGVSVYNPHMYYRPGYSSYSALGSAYYTSTNFKVLLDSSNYKYAKGTVPPSVARQIENYIQNADSRAKATNQFAIGTAQYYGYYDKDALAYVIEEIQIKK